VISAPGKFVVMAVARMSGAITLFSEDEGSAYGETYYPATANKSQASTVTVTAGREATGIDIRLIRKRVFTISGMVTGMPASAVSPMIWFSQSDGSDQFNGMSGFGAFPDGKFVLRGLSPGHYRVMARTDDVVASPALQSEFVDVTLENSDATNVSLTLAKGESLSGVLKTEGAKANEAPPGTPTVRLDPYPEGRTGRPKGGDVTPDGAFRFEDVFPGEYRVNVVPLPENAYLKSVNLDGAEVANATLRLSRGISGAKLSIKVSLNGAQLTGRVLDGDGQPLLTPALFAFAASVDDIQWEHLKEVRPGDSFTFNGVRPGTYRLLAISLPSMQDDIGAFRAMFSKGVEIEIHEGDRIVKDIQSVPTEDPDAKR